MEYLLPEFLENRLPLTWGCPLSLSNRAERVFAPAAGRTETFLLYYNDDVPAEERDRCKQHYLQAGQSVFRPVDMQADSLYNKGEEKEDDGSKAE